MIVKVLYDLHRPMEQVVAPEIDILQICMACKLDLMLSIRSLPCDLKASSIQWSSTGVKFNSTFGNQMGTSLGVTQHVTSAWPSSSCFTTKGLGKGVWNTVNIF